MQTESKPRYYSVIQDNIQNSRHQMHWMKGQIRGLITVVHGLSDPTPTPNNHVDELDKASY